MQRSEERRLAIVRFASVFFVALSLAPALAHLMELPNKIGLSHDAYLTVQQIYRGWQLLGIVVACALVSTLAYAIVARNRAAEFRAALAAFLCIVATQVIFWLVTFPVNKTTENWTTLPAESWEALRRQWEYSHATSAVIDLIAFVVLVFAVSISRGPGAPRILAFPRDPLDPHGGEVAS